MSTQHTQATLLQPSNIFSQQMQQPQQQQQQHVIQQQQQHTAAVQHASQPTTPIHRLQQTIHPTSVAAAAAAAASVNPQANVFPNAEFFQSLQHTVLPYDQTQYIGPLMYLPYPAAAANGIFGSNPSASDAQQQQQHINACSTASATTSTSQLLGTASLVSATYANSVMNQAVPATPLHGATGQLINPNTGLMGLPSTNNPVTTQTLAPVSLAPLLTTAHFYPSQQTDQSGNSQLHLQQSIQSTNHLHNSIQMQSHAAGVSSGSLQPSSTTTTILLPPGSVQQVNQSNTNAPTTPKQQHNGNTNMVGNDNVSGSVPLDSSTPACKMNIKNDESVHPKSSNLTPIKSGELINSHLTNHSFNSNGGGADGSSSSTKRDNNGTGHFVCNVCGREFGMRCRLIAHTRRHTGERPFPCSDCGRAFSDRGNLQRHRYTHSSQPRFHCSVCGKSFRQASCLSNHRRFHCAGATGRPCPFCQRSFRSSSSLQMHIRWKHRADAAAAVAAAAAAASVSTVANSAAAPDGCAGGDSGVSASIQNYIPTAYIPAAVTMNGALPIVSVNGSSLDLQYQSNLLSAAAAVAASSSVMNNGPTCCTSVTCGGDSLSTTNTSILLGGGGGVFNSFNSTELNCTVGPTVTGGSPNKRKWRRKPKPKQNAFGKITEDGMNILAGINLSEGIDVNAAAAAAGAAAAAIGGPVPLDRKGRPCNYPCPACPRRFAFQCRLAAHLRCHTNIRPFRCIDCGRAFTQRGYLVRHAAVHKLDRPFSCGLCDRSYKHYGSLVNHKRTHSKLLANSSMSLSHLSLLSRPSMEQVAGLSSLEEVVTGTVGQSEKDVTHAAAGIPSTTTTITLLPVTKMEEILPGDLSSSMQQVCLPCPQPTNNVLHPDPHNQSHSLPHQLTATAVWPILTSGTNPHSQMLATANVPQSHFQNLTISSSHPLSQSDQQQQHQHAQTHHISLISADQQQHLQHPSSTPMFSTTGPTAPTLVTLPLFGQGQPSDSELVSNSILNSVTHHTTQQPQFHTSNITFVTSSGASTCTINNNSSSTSTGIISVPDSSRQTPNTQHYSTATQQLQTIPINHQGGTAGDLNANAPVLHVLQPSPSIFFPYYLPHTASSHM